MTDGESWIRAVAVGRRYEEGGVASTRPGEGPRHLGFWPSLGSRCGARLSKILAWFVRSIFLPWGDRMRAQQRLQEPGLSLLHLGLSNAPKLIFSSYIWGNRGTECRKSLARALRYRQRAFLL